MLPMAPSSDLPPISEQHCLRLGRRSVRVGSVQLNPPATPFGGDYPRYGLTIVTPVYGTATGDGIEYGGSSTACDITLEQWSTAYALTATPDPGYIFTGVPRLQWRLDDHRQPEHAEDRAGRRSICRSRALHARSSCWRANWG